MELLCINVKQAQQAGSRASQANSKNRDGAWRAPGPPTAGAESCRASAHSCVRSARRHCRRHSACRDRPHWPPSQPAAMASAVSSACLMHPNRMPTTSTTGRPSCCARSAASCLSDKGIRKSPQHPRSRRRHAAGTASSGLTAARPVPQLRAGRRSRCAIRRRAVPPAATGSWLRRAPLPAPAHAAACTTPAYC